MNQIELFKLGGLFIDIYTLFPHNVFEEQYSENGNVILKINLSYIKEIKDNISVHPSTLPMICPPKLWSDKNKKGFITDIDDNNSLITGSAHHMHKVKNMGNLYKAVNSMSSVKFSINKDFLNYIKGKGAYLLENDSTEKDFKNNISLKIADIYENLPFYLNVHADWRGRLYTNSFFISYQESELSSSLLEFYDGEVLTEKGKQWLYIYGANLYNENKMSKSSYENRIRWVNDNYYKIIRMDKRYINKAECKIQFAAFCLAMKRLHDNPNIIIKLPVFLDATCSGLQHLAGLLRDFELGEMVNITPKERPEDLYESLVEPLNNEINKYGNENIGYSTLSNVKIDRKIIKRPIMTNTYNVSLKGVCDQIKDFLPKVKIEDHTYYKAESLKGDGFVNLSYIEVWKMAEIIHSIIFKQFPSLRLIYNYFLERVKLMLKL